VDMRPFSNSMMMKFIFQIAKKGKCEDTAPMNLQGAILRTSYLDLAGIPHWAVLPNLEIFANAGYPFTRRADLSDTAVVLPDAPSPEEIELYLTLMGHFGAQTGYPVTNVTVTNADGMTGSKDFLVLGTVDDSPAIAKLNPKLPVQLRTDGITIQDTGGFFHSTDRAWWKVKGSDHVETGQLVTNGGVLPDATIEGIESPMSGGHSVVVIALRDKSVVPNFLTVFLKTAQSSDIQQSVSVLAGSQFTSRRLGHDLYHVGTLGWYLQLGLLFSEFPWLIVILVALLAVLMAALLRAMLRRHARRRLQAND
jgi:cellulose synthase (UDP-forming)